MPSSNGHSGFGNFVSMQKIYAMITTWSYCYPQLLVPSPPIIHLKNKSNQKGPQSVNIITCQTETIWIKYGLLIPWVSRENILDSKLFLSFRKHYNSILPVFLQWWDFSWGGFVLLHLFIQVSLQLPLLCIHTGDFFLSLVYLSLQGLYTVVHLFNLELPDKQKQTWHLTVGVSHNPVRRRLCVSDCTCSLYWSAWRRSSSAWIAKSFSFFSCRLNNLCSWVLSLLKINQEIKSFSSSKIKSFFL